MTNDRQITISTGKSRKTVNWKTQTLMLSELYDRLALPVRSTETMAEYLRLPKGQQDDLKDVGGLVGGTLSGPRRKAGAVTGRDVLTLDLDNIPPYQADTVIKRVDSLGPGYCIYSTRKHRPDAPRLRVLVPLDRTATADEYEAVARRTAERIGMEHMDPTTFEPHRLMYYGSCCSDGEWVFYTADKPFLSVDGTLATYPDWKDRKTWPIAAGEEKKLRDSQKRQRDPTTKPGLVGAFCRTYNVPAAMDTFLPGVYEEAGESRYTFTGGSTTGGAVLYDDGKFLFSHHATDPCSGQLVNAWDLVRLHKFGNLDDEAPPGATGGSLPSYKAMVNFVRQDKDVLTQLARETLEKGLASASSGAVSASALMNKHFRQLVQPVHNLISEGLTLLVSASKIGKSWMVLLMGACVADGVPFWGRPTIKSRVLYLALEDSERRLQSRLRMLDLDHIPDNLFLQTTAPRIGEGFEEFLDTWLAEDEAPAVVIVDTLQKIRGIDGSGKNVYAVDYDVIGRLKALADRHRAAIVCVHHTNKSRNVNDPFDKISGSTAVMGAADTTILVSRDREQDTATVSLTGRDVYGPDFTIRFDSGVWSLVSDNAQEYQATQRYEGSPLVQTIRRLMTENPQGGRWTYGQLRDAGTSFGLVPFENGRDCGRQLSKGLASELLARDRLCIQWAVQLHEGRGVEIRPSGGV